jgi:ABC-2 type transport system ATP-binding protein
MKVEAYLAFIARLKGVREHGLRNKVRELIERVGLAGVEGKKCEELSKGMLQKIQFVAAIVHEPDLLILDEPFSGLDPISRRLLRDLIVAEHRRGATILFSTHVMPQAEEMCDHVVMIHRGRKMLDEPLRSIRQSYDPRAIEFETLTADADVAPVRSLPEVERCTRVSGAYEVLLREGSDAGRAMQHIVAAVPVARMERKRLRLEDVFVQIVNRGDEPAGEGLRSQLSGDGGETA